MKYRVLFARGGFPARGAGGGVPAWVWDEVPICQAPYMAFGECHVFSGSRWKTELRSVFGNMVSERTISIGCYAMFFKLGDTVK